jgi:hypothetical protein
MPAVLTFVLTRPKQPQVTAVTKAIAIVIRAIHARVLVTWMSWSNFSGVDSFSNADFRKKLGAAIIYIFLYFTFFVNNSTYDYRLGRL